MMAGLLGAQPIDAVAEQKCWLPKELSLRAGEHVIRKNVPEAFHPPPEGEAGATLGTYRPSGGVLRRVDLPPGKKLVALTFDLCEQPFEISGYQGDIVDFLRRKNVPATFFAGGKWMLTHQERAEQLVGDPLFEIGNHAWEHRNFRVASKARRLLEIDGALQAYDFTLQRLKERQCLARDGRVAYSIAPPRQTLFRFPFGACTEESIHEVESRGLLAVQWDVSSADPWTGQSAKGIVDTVVNGVKPGSIVLFHANGRGWKTGEALPYLVQQLEDKGYEFVTVSGLLSTPGAKPVIASECFDHRPRDVNRYDNLARRIEEQSELFYRRFVPPEHPLAKGRIAAEAGISPPPSEDAAPRPAQIRVSPWLHEFSGVASLRGIAPRLTSAPPLPERRP